MNLTTEQIHKATEFHYGKCQVIRGPRGGKTIRMEVWRRSGKTKTWKTRPSEFTIPIKHGLRDSGYLTQSNEHAFHLPEDCPLNKLVPCEHEWEEQPGEPPKDVCIKCGDTRE
jgi:hypothetical protein